MFFLEDIDLFLFLFFYAADRYLLYRKIKQTNPTQNVLSILHLPGDCLK